jgi:hypothetical protein
LKQAYKKLDLITRPRGMIGLDGAFDDSKAARKGSLSEGMICWVPLCRS